MILRVGYEVLTIKFLYGNRGVLKNIKAGTEFLYRWQGLRVINLALILCAIVGLSRTEWDNRLGNCRDLDYRIK